MTHYLINIFKNEIDESAHKKFIRYSKGEFEGARLELIIRGKKVSFYVDRDYDQYFLEFIINRIPTGEYKITGILLASKDSSKEIMNLGLEAKSRKSKGQYKISINGILNNNEIQSVYEKICELGYPLLSIKSQIKGSPWKIATKNSIPRPSGKEKNEEIRPNFCKGTFPIEKELLDQIIQDCLVDFIDISDELSKLSFKEFQLQNIFDIKKIILPDPKIKDELINYQRKLNQLIKESKKSEISRKESMKLKKEIKEFKKELQERSNKFRLSTKRQGEIRRIITLDKGKTYNNKFTFEA